jgi:tRNA (guanosine-2'-O-)-methyltransferase
MLKGMNRNIKKELREYFGQFVTKNRQEKIKKTLPLRTRRVGVALEDLYQAANTSAILRTCDALGIQDVHCIEGRNPFGVNNGISLGAAKWLTVDRYRTEENQTNNATRECVESLKKDGYKVVATSPHATMPISKLPVEDKTMFLFGTEDQGLTEEAINLADEVVEIPMYGFVESFNVSVSVALCLYDFTTRLRNSNVKWQLSEDELLDLEIDWMRNSVENADALERRFFEDRS